MDEETNGVDVKEEMSLECRTCLQTISSDTELYYIFQSWVPPWEGIDNTIAEALEKLAQVQISAVDQYSKVMCGMCCQKLYNACIFTTLIKQSDETLRQRHASGLQTEDTAEDNWPKPIKINVNIPAYDQIGVEVKKEVLFDEEDSEYSRVVEGQSDLTIKIEPEELVQQDSKLAINEAKRRWREKKKATSGSKFNKQAKTAAQRMREYRARKKLQPRLVAINKDVEHDEDQNSAQLLQCAPCNEQLIDEDYEDENPAQLLQRTPYNEQFIDEDDEDENPAQLLQCALCNEQFIDDYYMNIHLEIHHPASREGEVKVEALETLFT